MAILVLVAVWVDLDGGKDCMAPKRRSHRQQQPGCLCGYMEQSLVSVTTATKPDLY